MMSPVVYVRCPLCGERVGLTVAGYLRHRRPDRPDTKCKASGKRPHELRKEQV